jgi:hypothetical protein
VALLEDGVLHEPQVKIVSTLPDMEVILSVSASVSDAQAGDTFCCLFLACFRFSY